MRVSQNTFTVTIEKNNIKLEGTEFIHQRIELSNILNIFIENKREIEIEIITAFIFGHVHTYIQFEYKDKTYTMNKDYANFNINN